MKKKLRYFLCFLFWFAFLNCSAQPAAKTKAPSRFGLIVFPNCTEASLTSYIQTASAFNNYKRSYFGAGIGFEVHRLVNINSKLSCNPALGITVYNQKQIYCDNAKLNTLESVSYSDKLSESAISLSLLINYNVKSYSFSAGPQFDIVSAAKINSVTRLNGYGYTNRINDEINFKKNGKTENGVFLLKFGVSKHKISKKFGAGIFYIHSLSDFTRYYNIRKIGKINGLLLQFNFSF